MIAANSTSSTREKIISSTASKVWNASEISLGLAALPSYRWTLLWPEASKSLLASFFANWSEAAHSASPRKGARNETSGRYTRTRLRTIISHRPIDPFILLGMGYLNWWDSRNWITGRTTADISICVSDPTHDRWWMTTDDLVAANQ